ncbi:probable interferon-induced [Rhynchosporium graminicola]|uniref:non-specific serine/threonine protein kinase n=1 Tax=Rhynchosporium graminicola TaxID=2792576 RepID=A0A1E1LQM8_9HELO|nr:probable interferon-induced [Rhynchosporium commune]
MSLSLVPYSSRDSREIVLRHNDAIVIRDPVSRQLIIRGATPSPSFSSDCPTCHRPFRSSSPERNTSPHRSSPFISPEYFRMLQSAHNGTEEHEPPSSPIRRLVQTPFPSASNSTGGSVSDVEFVTSTPAPQTGHSIKKEAFSPNYFQQFFTEEKELGRGGKGVVLLVRHELDGVSLGQFACKRVPVGDDHAWLEKVLIEVQLLQGLSHPNLVSYRHVWLEDVRLHRFGPSVPCAFILQQYCNSGDLLHYIIGPAPEVRSVKEQLKEQMRRRSRGHSERPDLRYSQRKLSFEEIYSFFKDITSGLAHLHASNYIHRDLKPSNCLLHKDGNDFKCLISDFGEVQAENVARKSTGSTGTISYCAPEVLKKDELGRYGNFTTKSDIFSLGMILYFMCFGRLPYKSADSIQEEFEDIDSLRAEISGWSGFVDERRERPELPNQLYEFLKRLLALDPNERPSASDLLTAIRTEKGLEAPSRTRNGSNAGLGGRIIQSFDSPMPPGTPVNGIFLPFEFKFPFSWQKIEPSKRVRSGAYIEDAIEPSFPQPTPSSQLVLESKSRSPSRTPSPHRNDPPSLIPRTPLLMPPPSTLLSRLTHKVSIYRHYAGTWARLNRQPLHLFLRLAIFTVKVASVTRPCAPLVTKDIVMWPLVTLAAIELAIGTSLAWSVVVMSLVAHFVVLAVTVRFGGGLCIRDMNWGWTE